MEFNYVTGGRVLGGTCLYRQLGGAKALLYYINLQINESVGGEAKPRKIFIGGASPRASLQVHA